MSLDNEFHRVGCWVIPHDWKVKDLRLVSKVPMQNGLFFKPELKGTGSRIVNVGDLYSSVPINIDSLERFDASKAEKKRFKVEAGDIFFTRSSVVPSGIAHCNLFSSTDNESVVFDSHVIRFRPCVKSVNPQFLFRFCTSSIARGYLVSHAKTGTMTTIDQVVLGKCPVFLPPLAEQKAIAEALSDADGLIESLEQLIAKKRQIKQGAMQELLTGKRRLPGFEGEWKELALGEMLTICHGKTQRDVEDVNGFYPILASGGQIGTANSYLCDKPSVLIGRKGTIDRPQYMDKPFWTVDTLYYSIIHEPNNPKFLFYKFWLIDWRKHNEASGVPSLNARTVERIMVSVPDHREQNAIASILTDMDAEITELEAKLSKARKIKQGMMQELLTGRIRLV